MEVLQFLQAQLYLYAYFRVLFSTLITFDNNKHNFDILICSKVKRFTLYLSDKNT